MNDDLFGGLLIKSSLAFEPAVRGKHDDGVWTVCVTDSGDIVTGSVDENAILWSRNLEKKKKFDNHFLGVLSVCCDGRTLATSSIDCTIRFFDLDSFEPLGEIEAGPVECWTLAYRNNLLFSGTFDGVNVWKNREKQENKLEASSFVMSVEYSEDGSLLAAGGANGDVTIYDVETMQIVRNFKEDCDMPVRSLSWSGNDLVFAGCDDSRVLGFSPRDEAEVIELTRHTSWCLGVAVSPDKNFLASCSSDRSVKLWDLNKRDVCCVLDKSHDDQIWDVAFVDDSTLVSVSDDSTVQLYSACEPTNPVDKLPDIYLVGLGLKDAHQQQQQKKEADSSKEEEEEEVPVVPS